MTVGAAHLVFKRVVTPVAELILRHLHAPRAARTAAFDGHHMYAPYTECDVGKIPRSALINHRFAKRVSGLVIAETLQWEAA